MKNGGRRSKYSMRTKNIPRQNEYLLDHLVFLFQPLLFGRHVYESGDVIECESPEKAQRLEKNGAGYILENAPIISELLLGNPNDEFADLYADFLNVCKNLPDQYHTANYRQWCKSFWAPCDEDPKQGVMNFVESDSDTGTEKPMPKRKPRKKKIMPDT